MEDLQGWDVFCADKLTCETLTIPQLKSIILGGLGVNVQTHQQFHYVRGITDWIHVPAFTALGIKDLQNIGVSLKKIC